MGSGRGQQLLQRVLEPAGRVSEPSGGYQSPWSQRGKGGVPEPVGRPLKRRRAERDSKGPGKPSYNWVASEEVGRASEGNRRDCDRFGWASKKGIRGCWEGFRSNWEGVRRCWEVLGANWEGLRDSFEVHKGSWEGLGAMGESGGEGMKINRKDGAFSHMWWYHRSSLPMGPLL